MWSLTSVLVFFLNYVLNYTCNLQWRKKSQAVCKVTNPHTTRMGITAQADDDDE